jgi:hypothetical protein
MKEYFILLSHFLKIEALKVTIVQVALGTRTVAAIARKTRDVGKLRGSITFTSLTPLSGVRGWT